MTTSEKTMTPLETLADAEREFAAGNLRKSSRILWNATEATFDMLAKTHGLDPSNHIAVATALDEKYDLGLYYRGSLSTAEGAKLIGTAPGAVRAALKKLEQAGLIRAEGKTRARRYYLR